MVTSSADSVAITERRYLSFSPKRAALCEIVSSRSRRRSTILRCGACGQRKLPPPAKRCLQLLKTWRETSNSGTSRCHHQPASLRTGAEVDVLVFPTAMAKMHHVPALFFPPNAFLMLSNSSILAPCFFMMIDCCVTESVLFQAQ